MCSMSDVVIDHLGIAVEDMESALRFYGEVLGLSVREVEERPDLGLRIARLRVGAATLELVEAKDWMRTTQRHQSRRGPGVYHLGLRTGDVDAKVHELRAAGVALIDLVPRDGATMRAAFAHPAAGGGVLVELVTHRSKPES